MHAQRRCDVMFAGVVEPWKGLAINCIPVGRCNDFLVVEYATFPSNFDLLVTHLNLNCEESGKSSELNGGVSNILQLSTSLLVIT